MRRPRLSNAQLQKYIQEAYDAWWEEQQEFKKKFPAVTLPLNGGFQWPYQPTADLITPRVIAEVGSLTETRKQIKWRLAQVCYPYPQPEDQPPRKNFYQHLRKEKLLGILLRSKLIVQVRLTWFLLGHYAHEQRLYLEKKSEYGYPLKFHRDAMKQIAGDLLGLEAIAAQNEVLPEWFAQYRADALKALLREASICYPTIRMGFKSAVQFRPDKSTGDRQMELFQAIQTAFSGKSISDNLAHHLVALICSPLSSIQHGKLEPIPSGVGRNIRDRQKKL